MVIEVVAAAGENGEACGQWGILLLPLILLLYALPGIAIAVGALMVIVGCVRRFAREPVPAPSAGHSFGGQAVAHAGAVLAHEDDPSRRRRGTVLLAIGTALLAAGLVGTVYLLS